MELEDGQQRAGWLRLLEVPNSRPSRPGALT